MIFLRFVLALAFVAGQVEIRADEHCDVDSDENKACDGHSCTRRFTFTNMEEVKDDLREFMRKVLEKHQLIPCTTKPQETTVTKETNMETASITAVMDYESTTAAHPTTNEESTTTAHPTTNEESTMVAHPTTNEESNTATHPSTNEESTTAAHPTTNEESTTIREESNTASNPRKTGGTTLSCQDTCIPSSMSNDAVVRKRLGGWPTNQGHCRCRIDIQYRYNNRVSFVRNLAEYQQGFGDLTRYWDGDYWLGLDRIHAVTNQTGGVNMRIFACNKKVRNACDKKGWNACNKKGWKECNKQGWKYFSASGVHVAARSENYRLTMLDTNDEAMRQMNRSIFEVKNIEADGCKRVSGWWFGDISGDLKDEKWCNPNGPYHGRAGIKWRKDTGTSSGKGNAQYSSSWIVLGWITPSNA